LDFTGQTSSDRLTLFRAENLSGSVSWRPSLRPVFQSVLASAFFAMAGVADAGAFEDGQAAFDRHDYATALQVWQPLADHGDAQAQNKLGNMYWAGEGVPKVYTESVKWWRLAADQGYTKAQANLAAAYENGWGVSQDYSEAGRWYEAAARQGNARAEYKLGLMYSQGQGVPHDDEQAAKWFRLAANQGEVDARAKLTPAPPPAMPNPSINQPSGRAFLDCASTGATGATGEYTQEDVLRDARGFTFNQLGRLAEIISIMNCGRSFNRYTLHDLRCDPKFKGLSLEQARVIARVLSAATCG
jgi:hypothetical protein